MINTNDVIIGVISLLPLLILPFKGKFVYFITAAVTAVAINGAYLFGLQIFYLLLLAYIVSTVAELIALKTPVGCFGVKYRYNLSDFYFSSGIRYLKVYPLEVSFSWVIVKYLSFNLAVIITQAFLLPQIVFVFLTPLILLSLDFIIDPVCVNVMKLWRWKRGSGYFGIPLQNFLGWYIVGFVATLIFSFIDRGKPVSFNFLYILPIVFYASFIGYSLWTFKLNKKMATVGSIPVAIWTILSVIGLVILYYR